MKQEHYNLTMMHTSLQKVDQDYQFSRLKNVVQQSVHEGRPNKECLQ